MHFRQNTSFLKIPYREPIHMSWENCCEIRMWQHKAAELVYESACFEPTCLDTDYEDIMWVRYVSKDLSTNYRKLFKHKRDEHKSEACRRLRHISAQSETLHKRSIWSPQGRYISAQSEILHIYYIWAPHKFAIWRTQRFSEKNFK